MGRAPCCDKANVKKGPWSPEEDAKLKSYIEQHGTGGNWIALPQKIGLKRCGKSCRLRWLNYLRPNIKHGGFSEEEDRIICGLYVSIGSRWSIIAAQLPGRTDNDIKNYWNTRLKKKLFGKQRKDHHQQQRQATRRGNALKQMQQMKRSSEDHNTIHGAENYNNNSNTATMFSLNDGHNNNNIPYWPQQLPMAQHYNNNNMASSDHVNPNIGAQLFMEEESLYNSNGFGQFLPIVMQGQSSSQMVELENNNYNMGFDDDPRRVLCGLEFLYGDHHQMANDRGCQMGSQLISSSCPSNYEAMLQDLPTTEEYNANFDELRISDNHAR